jgi:hypothetical protein
LQIQRALGGSDLKNNPTNYYRSLTSREPTIR